jgi:hypothetical protein
VLGVLAACASETPPPEPPAPPGAPRSLGERPCPEGFSLGWESFGQPFLLSWCTGCHSSGLADAERGGAPKGTDFDRLEDVRAWADRIWARAADHNRGMPPVGGPDDADRELLGAWLACGAPGTDDGWPAPSGGTGSGGGPAPTCPGDPADDACAACVKDKCCAEAVACVNDRGCSCWLGCVGAGGTEQSCTMQCGMIGGATYALFGCAAQKCAACQAS